MPGPDARQTDEYRDIERTQPRRDAADRWTTALTQRGFTPVSNQFLETYSRLRPRITHGEAMFIIHLMQHKWDENAPYPSLTTVAKRMGISTTSSRSLARSLEKKGYLRREGRPGYANRYHLDRLFEALESFEPSEATSPVESEDVESAFEELLGEGPTLDSDIEF